MEARLPDLNGQMVEDWFRQVLEACLYGMRQSGETEAPLEEEMDKRFWHCTDMAAVYRLLRQGIQAEIQRLKEAQSPAGDAADHRGKALYPAALSGGPAAGGCQHRRGLQRHLFFHTVQKKRPGRTSWTI